MKHLNLIVVLMLVVLSGCSKLNDSIQELQNRVDLLENVTIANINQQIDGVKNSIASLNAADSELGDYIETIQASVDNLNTQLESTNADIDALKAEFGDDLTATEKAIMEHLNEIKKALEDQIARLGKTIEALTSRSDGLEKKIVELEKYLESELEGSSDWAGSTFATLEQYAAVQSDISAIKAIAKQINDDLDDLEMELKSKIDNDISDAIDQLRGEVSSDISSLESRISNVAQNCRNSLKEECDKIAASYMAAIASSIAESEKSMKTWVNARLAEGYYDIAAIDAEIAALEIRITEGDKELEDIIIEQQKALTSAKAEMEEAYQEVIDEIVKNNGRINKTIDEKVNAATNILQSQIDDIDKAIEELKQRVKELEDRVDELEEKRIKTIEEQIVGINKSIEDLKIVDAKLDGFIEALQLTAEDLQNQLDEVNTKIDEELAAINKSIEALKAKDVEIEGKITALKTYVDTQLQETADWVNATFATLEQYEDIQGEISDIKTIISNLKTQMSEDIQNAISDLETSMKNWVNGVLADGYYTKAEIDGKIAALQTQVAESDEALQDDIDELTDALEQAKSDLKEAYEQAIKDAITVNNGIISADIAAAVKTAQDNLQKKIDDINSEISEITTRLTSIENTLDKRIQSIRFMPEFSDRCVALGLETRSMQLDFMVSPAKVATALGSLWQSKPEIIQGYLIYTMTRSSSNPIPLSVFSVTGNADGLLSVILKEDPQNPLSDELWEGKQDAVVYIKINDGNNDIQSELISTKYTGYEVVENANDGTSTYYVDALPGLLKWAYDVNVLDKRDANLILENNVEVPQYEIVQDDKSQTYKYSDVPITVDPATGIPSGSNWVPVGEYIENTDLSKAFKGNIDGKDKVISGIRINMTNTTGVGLVGEFADGTIRNIKLSNSYIYGDAEAVGGIVGDNRYNTVIENVHVIGSHIKGHSYVGGIVGYNYRRRKDVTQTHERISYVNGCSTDESCTVTGVDSYIGGICGYNYGHAIIGCLNDADVTGTTLIGGIAGETRTYTKYSVNGYVTASVSGSAATITATAANGSAGGIAGRNWRDHNHLPSESYIVACYSLSTVVAHYAGSIIGSVYNDNHNGLVYSSFAVKNGLTNIIGFNYKETIVFASDHFDAATDITEEFVNNMNDEIVKYNGNLKDLQEDAIESLKCHYKWQYNSGRWPTLTPVNQ